MTAHVGTMSVDGTPISQADMARIEAEEALHADSSVAPCGVVAAASALDVDDCRMLLSILGLGRRRRRERPRRAAPVAPAADGKRARKRRAA